MLRLGHSRSAADESTHPRPCWSGSWAQLARAVSSPCAAEPRPPASLPCAGESHKKGNTNRLWLEELKPAGHRHGDKPLKYYSEGPVSRDLSSEWKESLKRAEPARGLALSCLFCSDEILQEGRAVALSDLHIPRSFHQLQLPLWVSFEEKGKTHPLAFPC